MGLVFLTGMPGAGKSTVGTLLADRLETYFVDLDGQIERFTESSVVEIFDRFGEARFRELETRILQEVLQLQTGVVALGGGTLEWKGNLELVRSAGKLVYLKANVKLLAARLIHSQNRPLLFGAETREELEAKLAELLESRSECYEQASMIVEVFPEATPDDLVRKIVGELQ